VGRVSAKEICIKEKSCNNFGLAGVSVS